MTQESEHIKERSIDPSQRRSLFFVLLSFLSVLCLSSISFFLNFPSSSPRSSSGLLLPSGLTEFRLPGLQQVVRADGSEGAEDVPSCVDEEAGMMRKNQDSGGD